MDVQQKALKARIREAREKPSGFNYIPKNWNKKIWDKPLGEINDYILDRLDNANDEIEYYTCLVYLYSNTTKFNKLLVEWKDSTAYQALLRSLKEEDKKMTVNKPDKTKRVNKKVDATKTMSKTKVEPKKLSSTVPITKNFI